jgi:SAM-dependent methyltransferase
MALIWPRYALNLADSGYWFERALARELQAFARSAGPDAVAVDFGCGTRPYARHLAGFAGCQIGIDVYPGARVDVVYDGRRLPLADACADLVFAANVFEHVTELDAALSEIGRVLKPGGRLVAAAPFISHAHGTPHDFHRPTRFDWLRRIAAAIPGARVRVDAVDSRLTCLIALATAQMNFVIYDLLRRLDRKPAAAGSLTSGAASPESASWKVRAARGLVQLNPLNFVLGLLAFALAPLAPARRAEGEITCGYLIVAEISRR